MPNYNKAIAPPVPNAPSAEEMGRAERDSDSEFDFSYLREQAHSLSFAFPSAFTERFPLCPFRGALHITPKM